MLTEMVYVLIIQSLTGVAVAAVAWVGVCTRLHRLWGELTPNVDCIEAAFHLSFCYFVTLPHEHLGAFPSQFS